jgi:hypothetical protein
VFAMRNTWAIPCVSTFLAASPAIVWVLRYSQARPTTRLNLSGDRHAAVDCGGQRMPIAGVIAPRTASVEHLVCARSHDRRQVDRRPEA